MVQRVIYMLLEEIIQLIFGGITSIKIHGRLWRVLLRNFIMVVHLTMMVNDIYMLFLEMTMLFIVMTHKIIFGQPLLMLNLAILMKEMDKDFMWDQIVFMMERMPFMFYKEIIILTLPNILLMIIKKEEKRKIRGHH